MDTNKIINLASPAGVSKKYEMAAVNGSRLDRGLDTASTISRRNGGTSEAHLELPAIPLFYYYSFYFYYRKPLATNYPVFDGKIPVSFFNSLQFARHAYSVICFD